MPEHQPGGNVIGSDQTPEVQKQPPSELARRRVGEAGLNVILGANETLHRPSAETPRYNLQPTPGIIAPLEAPASSRLPDSETPPAPDQWAQERPADPLIPDLGVKERTSKPLPPGGMIT